jgi:hypothetical protein
MKVYAYIKVYEDQEMIHYVLKMSLTLHKLVRECTNVQYKAGNVYISMDLKLLVS